jgi:hypothetical protein
MKDHIRRRLWVAALLLTVGSASAHEEATQGGEGQVQEVTGEVVDLACYLDHGAMGEEHRECAQKCIASGVPVGIKAGDTLYLAIGSEHGPANATLAPLAARQVRAEGVVSERSGVHLIAVKKVTVSE